MGLNTGAIMQNAVLLSLAALLPGGVCFAQVEPWERVRLIEEGKNVSVTLHSGAKVNGKMQAWNPDGMSVRRGKKVIAVEKTEVARVEFVTGMSRGRRAAWAGGITGGIIAGLSGAVCGAYHCHPSAGAVVAANGAIYGAAAAGIAALFPPHKETIYNALSPARPHTGVLWLSPQDPSTKTGGKIRIKLRLTDAGGQNVSSPGVMVRAAELTPEAPWREANPDGAFRYDSKLEGYVFNLDTKGLEPGDYSLNVRVGDEPTDYTMRFRVKA